jgi:hypothetical protein
MICYLYRDELENIITGENFVVKDSNDEKMDSYHKELDWKALKKYDWNFGHEIYK